MADPGGVKPSHRPPFSKSGSGPLHVCIPNVCVRVCMYHVRGRAYVCVYAHIQYAGARVRTYTCMYMYDCMQARIQDFLKGGG